MVINHEKGLIIQNNERPVFNEVYASSDIC